MTKDRSDVARWLEGPYARASAKSPLRRERFESPSGIERAPLYARPGEAAQGLPGEYPYTRGIHPTMYRSRLWTMRRITSNHRLAGHKSLLSGSGRLLTMPGLYQSDGGRGIRKIRWRATS